MAHFPGPVSKALLLLYLLHTNPCQALSPLLPISNTPKPPSPLQRSLSEHHAPLLRPWEDLAQTHLPQVSPSLSEWAESRNLGVQEATLSSALSLEATLPQSSRLSPPSKRFYPHPHPLPSPRPAFRSLKHETGWHGSHRSGALRNMRLPVKTKLGIQSQDKPIDPSSSGPSVDSATSATLQDQSSDGGSAGIPQLQPPPPPVGPGSPELPPSGEERPVEVILAPGNGTCLDGSQPAYYLRRGYGSGQSSWVLYLVGGGWCFDWNSCALRSTTPMGSTSFLNPVLGNQTQSAVVDSPLMPAPYGQGILSQNETENPDFFNWNVGIIWYCDGAAHLGQRGTAQEGDSELEFEGLAGLSQVLLDMKTRQGLDNATDALVSGCSAGGHSVSILCDWIVDHLDPTTRAKCISDAGFFLDYPDVNGVPAFNDAMQSLHLMQWAALSANTECVRDHSARPWLCLLPEVALRYTNTPTLVINSLFDAVYLNMFVLHRVRPFILTPLPVMRCIEAGIGRWCSPKTRELLSGYGRAMTSRASEIKESRAKNGTGSGTRSRVRVQEGGGGTEGVEFMLLTSAGHCFLANSKWSTTREGGVTVRDRVSTWFFSAEDVPLPVHPRPGGGPGDMSSPNNSSNGSTLTQYRPLDSKHTGMEHSSSLFSVMLILVLGLSFMVHV